MASDKRRVMVGDEVYERLKGMLMDLVIAPGARVSIDGIARELKVSQTPVREALARLESDELVLKLPLRGYRATELLTSEEFDDLYQFRRLIEPWAARWAASRIDDEGREMLSAELGAIAPPTRSDYAAYKELSEHDSRFHGLITRLSGNDQVRRAFERTHCHLHVFRLQWDREFGPETLEEHGRIAQAIVDGDPDEAERWMLDHLERGMTQRLRGMFRVTCKAQD